MNFKLKIAAAAMLAVCCVVSYGQTSSDKPMKKHVAAKKVETAPEPVETRKVKAPAPASVEDQIEALKHELEGQIDSLKTDLANKDEQLKMAQQTAAAAQAQAAKAQAAAEAQQQTLSDNAAAVQTLQTSVTDLKGVQVSLATTVSDETTKIKKDFGNPDAIRYKGITISPAGSFIEAATVNRTAATGGGINTPFTSVPLQNADNAKLSEFDGSGRQSRLAIKAVGKVKDTTFTGYYELDWLGTGITSNNNQSNSYVMRQRQLWTSAAMKSGWTISGGQMWSLASETTKGLTNGSEILPGTIDPQYTAGFVWTRQYGFRVAKQFGKSFWLGASAENAENLNPSGTIALTSGTSILIGSGGTGGGLYNSTANYSFNYAPDFVVKAAFEPGWGHWELFGIQRTFRDRIYATGATPYNDKEIGAGIGGGFRGPLFDKKLSIGLKGLWGQGVGRYGDSQLGDVTIKPSGIIAPLHGFSALSTLEANPNKRLSLYFNYGGEYLNRLILSTTSNVGYGNPLANMSGCLTEVAASTTYSNSGTGFGNGANPANCGANNKDVQEFSSGYWYNFYNGPMGRFRQGFQYSFIRRDLWSGAGGTTNPGGGAHGNDNIIETSLRYYLP